MSGLLADLVRRFGGLTVLVVGEAMLDSYLDGSTGRLCREAPVPIVAVRSRSDAPGGAANVATNVRSLGAGVVLLSVLGEDAEGDRLRTALAERGVSGEHLVGDRSRSTLAKHRVVADGQMLVRFDQGTTDGLRPETEAALLARLDHWLDRVDAVVVSDYGYGILGPRAIERLAARAGGRPGVVVVDARDLPRYHRVGPTAVKPNWEEAARLVGVPATGAGPDRAGQVVEWGDRLLELTGARLAAVTLDTDGAVLLERSRPPYRTYARPTRHARAAGAGDTFVAALGLALAAGADTPAAADLAAAAAAVVVGKDGTAACSAFELGRYLGATDKTVADLDALAAQVEFHRRQGRRIVFTNGCFDILHRGHITYLNRAKALGDVLVVGLNSDEGVRRLKGPDRPINPLEDRAEVLAALSCVDHIVAFEADTPVELIRRIRPEVYVKGGDYTRAALPEAPVVEALGGAVRILPYVADRSTTGIIRRIREEAGPSRAAAR